MERQAIKNDRVHNGRCHDGEIFLKLGILIFRVVYGHARATNLCCHFLVSRTKALLSNTLISGKLYLCSV